MMRITQCTVFPIKEPQGKLLAFARICLEDQLQLTSLRIYRGTHGLFVSYPNDTSYQGEDYRQVFYPVTMELRRHIEDTVIYEYVYGMNPELFETKDEDVIGALGTIDCPEVKRVFMEHFKRQLGGV